MGRLDGKIAVITGTASGQGRAAAVRFAEEGAKLALSDIDVDGLAGTAELVEKAGGQVVTHAGDISDPATIDALVSAAENEWGAPNVLYNNAGIMVGKKLEETTYEEFHQLVNVNCYAQLVAIQRVIPGMHASRGGSIINVSSISALAAFPQLAAYCASKAAVIGLTLGVAVDVAEDIRCNCICPAAVDTPMAKRLADSFDDAEAVYAGMQKPERQLLKRMAEPREIAEVGLFLASDESSFMTGSVINADGGWLAW